MPVSVAASALLSSLVKTDITVGDVDRRVLGAPFRTRIAAIEAVSEALRTDGWDLKRLIQSLAALSGVSTVEESTRRLAHDLMTIAELASPRFGEFSSMAFVLAARASRDVPDLAHQHFCTAIDQYLAVCISVAMRRRPNHNNRLLSWSASKKPATARSNWPS